MVVVCLFVACTCANFCFTFACIDSSRHPERLWGRGGCPSCRADPQRVGFPAGIRHRARIRVVPQQDPWVLVHHQAHWDAPETCRGVRFVFVCLRSMVCILQGGRGLGFWEGRCYVLYICHLWVFSSGRFRVLFLKTAYSYIVLHYPYVCVSVCDVSAGHHFTWQSEHNNFGNWHSQFKLFDSDCNRVNIYVKNKSKTVNVCVGIFTHLYECVRVIKCACIGYMWEWVTALYFIWPWPLFTVMTSLTFWPWWTLRLARATLWLREDTSSSPQLPCIPWGKSSSSVECRCQCMQ